MTQERTGSSRGNRRTRDELRSGLEDVRSRTLLLVEPLSAEVLDRQHSPLMSPIAWDLGHIAAFEELWLVRKLGEASSEQEIEQAFDAFRTPRSRRGELDIPDVEALHRRLLETRQAALEGLAGVDLDSENPLLRSGYVYEMVRDHEAQHQETILQAVMLMEAERYEPARREAIPPRDPDAPEAGFVRVPAGTFRMGDASSSFAYDNERPGWDATTDEYEIGRYPVTNAGFVQFVAAGGYLDPNAWSPEGWSWRKEAGLVGPGGWVLRGETGPPEAATAMEASRGAGLSAWRRRSGVGEFDLSPLKPVMHVCYWEAEAFARFAGARLPSEIEWEKAAAWEPDRGTSRSFPWGEEEPTAARANLDQLRFGPAPVGAYAEGRSAVGCWGMLGDTWEWTRSSFRPYEGFRAFPYSEYSDVFFGNEYRVLKGGSWATRPTVARCSFRNWDYPIRRQIFAGIRLARDV